MIFFFDVWIQFIEYIEPSVQSVKPQKLTIEYTLYS